jgi:ribonucleoside-diphosphate reductase alpha chain
VTNQFLEKVKAGDQKARKLWAKVLQVRSEIGYPYILFTDNINNGRPDVYKDKNMEIYASNMCSEIALPSNPEETFTCVLSSVNLLHWEEIKETDAIETLTYFLDTVVTEFIIKTEGSQYHKRARNFAMRHRALGLGVLGWHSYLQSKMIAFESRTAAKKNLEIAKTLRERTYKASAELAAKFGEPELLKGYGRRNTTLMAIAPTKSSSSILGQVSQSVEPEFSNYYVKDLAKSKTTIKNPFLKKILEDMNKDTPEVWDSIQKADGSIQHLDFLTEFIKEVFKTFAEINPEAIIDQAGVRQEHIDQAQSINLMIPADISVKEINALYLRAHSMGVKTLYYQYGMSQAQMLSRKKVMNQTCASCEG